MRSNIAVDKQLAQRLADVAGVKGKSIYALTNEIVKTSLDIIDKGFEISDLSSIVKVIKSMRELDALPVPGNLMDTVIKMLYINDREGLMQVGFKEGERVGEYFLSFHKSFIEMVSEYKNILVKLSPLKRLELVPASENADGGVYTLRAIGVGRCKETTEFVGEFLRGLLSVYVEVKVADIRAGNGLLELELHISEDGLDSRTRLRVG